MCSFSSSDFLSLKNLLLKTVFQRMFMLLEQKINLHLTLPVELSVIVPRRKLHVNFERLGDPEHFADMILTMIDNPMMNGETVRLDGSIRMPP